MQIKKGEVLSLIPARCGSKGVPDKNIKLLAGIPLMAYSIAAARMARLIDRVIVSTDAEAYAEIACRYGAEVPFLRPTNIAGDQSLDIEFVRHALDWLQRNDGGCPEYLVHLRPTTPLRDAAVIDRAIEAIRRVPEATALRSVHEMSESVYKAFEVENGYLKTVGNGTFDIEDANRPRQEFPKTYKGNGYVDIIRSPYVIENGKLHGDRVMAFVTPPINEVDTPDDFDWITCQLATSTAYKAIAQQIKNRGAKSG